MDRTMTFLLLILVIGSSLAESPPRKRDIKLAAPKGKRTTLSAYDIPNFYPYLSGVHGAPHHIPNSLGYYGGHNGYSLHGKGYPIQPYLLASPNTFASPNIRGIFPAGAFALPALGHGLQALSAGYPTPSYAASPYKLGPVTFGMHGGGSSPPFSSPYSSSSSFKGPVTSTGFTPIISNSISSSASHPSSSSYSSPPAMKALLSGYSNSYSSPSYSSPSSYSASLTASPPSKPFSSYSSYPPTSSSYSDSVNDVASDGSYSSPSVPYSQPSYSSPTSSYGSSYNYGNGFSE